MAEPEKGILIILIIGMVPTLRLRALLCSALLLRAAHPAPRYILGGLAM